MHRRTFLGTLGGAAGVSVAGCSDVEFDSRTPPEEPVERIRFLERERAALLYGVGLLHVDQGQRAATSANGAAKSADARLATLYHGQSAAYYDAAVSCFDVAVRVLERLSDLPLDAPVAASRDARLKANHLGRAQVHLANRFLSADLAADEDTEATATAAGMQQAGTADEDGGMATMAPPEEDDGMATMAQPTAETTGGMQGAPQPPEELHQSGVTDQQVLAEDHLDRAAALEFSPLSAFRQALGIADG